MPADQINPDMPDEVQKAVAGVGQALRKKPTRPRFKRHRDDERFDEVRVFIRERYKTSGLSGDEWRFGHVAQILWKGEVIAERNFLNLADALLHLASWVDGHGRGMLDDDDFTKIKWPSEQQTWDRCFQPGCPNDAVSTYKIKQEYEGPGTNEVPHNKLIKPKHRRFCLKHLKRGDCAMEDADVNYEVVDGPGPEDANMKGANVSESIFGGVVDGGDLSD